MCSNSPSISMLRRTLFAASLASAFLVLGCDDNPYQASQQPPPPAVYTQPTANIDLAERNGFEAGERDGQRDSYNGYRYEPRATRAYRQTPGYDHHLGPFAPYVNTFRNAYLRGYGQSYPQR